MKAVGCIQSYERVGSVDKTIGLANITSLNIMKETQKDVQAKCESLVKLIS